MRRSAQQVLSLSLQLLLLCGLWTQGTATAAQEPIGAAAACGAGQVYRVTCFIDGSGHLADVQYDNSISSTPVSLCHTQDWQLQASQPQTLELSAADTIVRFRACSDAAGGLRGLVFLTALGEELSCGSPAGGSCRSFSSSSNYPLRGMQATCQTLRPAHSGRGASGTTGLTRVSSITAACWAPVRRQARAQACPPGFGVRGGGLPCQPCPLNYFSPGGTSPCKPCPAGTTTLAAGQSKCGCFPGQGVYGPVLQDPEVCEDCPAGTYAGGGALAPCQPCSTNAFDYLTSAPGSQSIADCTCAAGFGTMTAAPTTCTMCRNGYFSEGPLSPLDTAAVQSNRPAGSSSSSSTSGGPKGPQSTRQQERAVRPAAAPPPPSPPPKAPPAAAPPPAPAPSRLPGAPAPPPPQLRVTASPTASAVRPVGGTNTADPAQPSRGSNAAAAAASAIPPSAPAPAQHSTQRPSGNSTAKPAAAAGGGPQQRSLKQISKVFSTPTYNPCTFCGPGCSTGGPGATSPQQCNCVFIPPVPPTSPSPPSPPSSPAPPASPTPTASPSPSPSPRPPSPSPSPPPGTDYCIVCNVNTIQQLMSTQCRVGGAIAFQIFDNTVGPGGTGLPCYIAAAFPGTKVTSWRTESAAFPNVNLITSAGLVDCSLVRASPGDAVLIFEGSPPSSGSGTCLMESLYDLQVPVIPVSSPAPSRGTRPRRTRTGRAGHAGRAVSNHTSVPTMG